MTQALVLRVCDKDGKSHGGFQWPLTVGATVTAPYWESNPECGNGLHGWLYGAGELVTDYWKQEGAKWLVLEVDLSSVVMLGSKCKFPSCVVKLVGDAKTATDYLWEHEPQSRKVAVIGACRADKSEKANVVVGPLGSASAGYSGTASAGNYGTASAGDYGTASAGNSGTASAGDYGTASAGDSGTASAGDSGTASAGDYGTASAGDSGVISILWYDAKANKYRRAIAAVGENGIEPNTPYRLDTNGKFVKSKP